MNYYEHHIGDYAQATFHLSFVEDAAYSRLLRKYYAEEKPLPADLRAVQRLVGARTDEEREAVATILEEFFTLESDGWHNKRADAEIAKVAEKREKASRSARERWNANASDSDANASNKDANASNSDAKAMLATNATHSERNAHQSPVTRHQKEEQELRSPSGSRLPEDWKLPPDWRAWARRERPEIDPDAEADKFRDFWHAKAGKDARKANWQATWRNWIRNAAAGRKPRSGPSAADDFLAVAQ